MGWGEAQHAHELHRKRPQKARACCPTHPAPHDTNPSEPLTTEASKTARTHGDRDEVTYPHGQHPADAVRDAIWDAILVAAVAVLLIWTSTSTYSRPFASVLHDLAADSLRRHHHHHHHHHHPLLTPPPRRLHLPLALPHHDCGVAPAVPKHSGFRFRHSCSPAAGACPAERGARRPGAGECTRRAQPAFGPLLRRHALPVRRLPWPQALRRWGGSARAAPGTRTCPRPRSVHAHVLPPHTHTHTAARGRTFMGMAATWNMLFINRAPANTVW